MVVKLDKGLTDEALEAMQDEMDAFIDDYDVDTGETHLIVQRDEIDADYTANGDIERSEAWGQIAHTEIVTINVKSLKWEGHNILNDDVIWQIWEYDNDC